MRRLLVLVISFIYSIPFYFGSYESDWITYREYLLDYDKYSLNEYLLFTYRTEYGFDLFMYLFMYVFRNPDLFLPFNVFITTMFFLFGIIKLLKISNKSDILLLGFVLFINYPLIELNSNIIRQTLALGLIIYLLSNKKKLIGLIAFIHLTSLVYYFAMILNKIFSNKWFKLIPFIMLILFRNNILEFLGQYLHSYYDTPNPIFVLVVFLSSLLIRKSSKDLSNFGLLTTILTLYIWPLSQFSNRFILFGHGVIVPFIYLFLKKVLIKLNA